MLYRLHKKNVRKEKLEKISNIEYFKETALRWKNCSYENKKAHALVEWEKGEKMAHKACKGTFFKESFLISKEKIASASNNTDKNTTLEDLTSIHSNIQYIQYPFGFQCFVQTNQSYFRHKTL